MNPDEHTKIQAYVLCYYTVSFFNIIFNMIMKLAAAWLFGSLGKTINFRLVEHGVMSSDNLVSFQPEIFVNTSTFAFLY